MRTVYLVMSAANFAAALAFPVARGPFMIASGLLLIASVILAYLESKRND
jgi:hypothetical protein